MTNYSRQIFEKYFLNELFICEMTHFINNMIKREGILREDIFYSNPFQQSNIKYWYLACSLDYKDTDILEMLINHNISHIYIDGDLFIGLCVDEVKDLYDVPDWRSFYDNFKDLYQEIYMKKVMKK